jgi:auxin efflux carrier family protein
MFQVGAIIVYTYVFKMLAPPPGQTFDGSEEDELPIKASGENTVPHLGKYPTNTLTSTVPEDEPLLSAEEDQKERATSPASIVKNSDHWLKLNTNLRHLLRSGK